MWVRGLDWAQLGDTPVFSIPVTVPVSSCRLCGQLAVPSAAGHPHWPHSRVSQLARCWLRHLGCFPRGVSSCQWLARAGRERRESTCTQRLQGFLRLRLRTDPDYFHSKQVLSSAGSQGVEKHTPSLNRRIFTVPLRGHRHRERQNLWPFL